jgi:pyruvate/2-oxoglutarate/acetoin dehydrogenase E1 component
MTKIILAELRSSDIRKKITFGVYIEFISSENVKSDDLFKVKLNNSIYHFEAKDIITEGDYLRIIAKETGYWADQINTDVIDLRTLIGCEVSAIIDETEKNIIREKSLWC